MAMKKVQQKPDQEFEQRLIEVARVTRVMKGGKRMRFRALLAIGDRKGRVGYGIAKGADVTAAIQKAFHQAKKNLIHVPIVNGTIPHEVNIKFKASKALIKPAKPGTGVKAGGAVRTILELAGVQDVTAKILGGNNKINNVRVAFEALSGFKLTEKMKTDLDKKKDAQARKDAAQKSQRKTGRRPGRFGGDKRDSQRGPSKPMGNKRPVAKKVEKKETK